MFCFRADAGLREIEAHAPQALEAVRRALEEATDDLGMLRLGEAFLAAPKISFDRAVMERTTRAAVLAADFAWSDIGDWKAVWQHSPRDADGVAREGNVHARDVTDSYLRSDGRLLCVLGVSGLAVIDTAGRGAGGADRAGAGGAGLVAELEASGVTEAATPARVHRPWGWYQTMDLGERFRVKRLVVAPGKQLSLQKHHHRAEHWVVVRGTAEVIARRRADLVQGERVGLSALGLRAPAVQSREDPGRDRGGPDRHLSRGGRHRADRGRFRPLVRRLRSSGRAGCAASSRR